MKETILSYGGGVNSTALAVLKESEIDEMVFVDHGGDYPETYEYVKYMERRGFPITILKPDVEGFSNLPEYCEEKKLFPTWKCRFCTDKFKIRPQNKYMKGFMGKLFIGFCKGEEGRKSEFRYKKHIFASYPLIQAGIDRQGCIELIKEAGLKVPCRSKG
jgi:3'-phosphoadenosine 5'-phosphosulfate sulfotransferase (PAPS reductase)/FAD synthetase